MIDCIGCKLDVIHESDGERKNCIYRYQCERAYQQGREDAIDELVEKLLSDLVLIKPTEQQIRRLAEQMKGETE